MLWLKNVLLFSTLFFSAGVMVHSDYRWLGVSLVLKDSIDGDVLVAGWKIQIGGVITGDVIVMARDVELEGCWVQGRVYILARTVKIRGCEIQDRVSVLSQRTQILRTRMEAEARIQSVKLFVESVRWKDQVFLTVSHHLRGADVEFSRARIYVGDTFHLRESRWKAPAEVVARTLLWKDVWVGDTIRVDANVILQQLQGPGILRKDPSLRQKMGGMRAEAVGWTSSFLRILGLLWFILWLSSGGIVLLILWRAGTDRWRSFFRWEGKLVFRAVLSGVVLMLGMVMAELVLFMSVIGTPLALLLTGLLLVWVWFTLPLNSLAFAVWLFGAFLKNRHWLTGWAFSLMCGSGWILVLWKGGWIGWGIYGLFSLYTTGVLLHEGWRRVRTRV